MKLLLIGSGGREHSLAWKLAKSEKVEKIFVAPGNGGTAIENKCENINITDIDELVKFAQKEIIDITIVGPEDPLTKGIVNEFKKEGLKIFGPAENGAQLEGSKSFSKEFMKKYGVKTAEYETFTNVDEALKYLETCPYPTVVKADGLAAGKGVAICANKEEAIEAVKSYMIDDIFNGAGQKIVIEEFLEGVEASILSITDGKTIIPFISGKDHKQIFDGGKGPNTGGMGVLAPNPYVTEDALREELDKITIKWKDGVCINVVLASGGYPGEFVKGYEISIDEKVKDKVFLAGAIAKDGILKTNGGRVLSVIGTGKNVEEARNEAYENIKYVTFKDAYCRTDIGIHK